MAPRTTKEIAAEQLGESWSPGQADPKQGRVQPVQSTGVIENRNPYDLRQNLSDLIAKGLIATGSSPQGAYSWSPTLEAGTEFVPWLGAAPAAQDAYYAAKSGDPTRIGEQGAMLLANLMIPKVLHAAGKVGKTVLDKAGRAVAPLGAATGVGIGSMLPGEDR